MIHADAYLSNILYRVVDGSVEIKIIDWDTSHLIREGDWMPAYRERVESNGRVKPFKVDVDDEYVDIITSVVGTPSAAELKLESGPDLTKDLNAAFRTLVARHRGVQSDPENGTSGSDSQ